MVGLRWFWGETEAVDHEGWIDQAKAREVLAATEYLKQGCDRDYIVLGDRRDRGYTVLDDLGRVVILDAQEQLVLSGSWVKREVYAHRMTVEVADQILADARRQLRARRGIDGWDITPAIRFAIAVCVYVCEGSRQEETVLNQRQYDAIWRSMETELGPGHLHDYRPRYSEGLTIREFWNQLTGLKDPQPRFEMIEWDFEEPLSTKVSIATPDIPWLNGTDGLPQVLPSQRFDAYLAYTYGTRLQGIDLMLNTTLKEMTQYAQSVEEQIGAILYPAGEFLTQVVKRYQLRSYPQHPNLYWVPTYTLNGTQPIAQNLEVVRLMVNIYEEKENIDLEMQAQDDKWPIMYKFFNACEYGLYWSLYYAIYPKDGQLISDSYLEPDCLPSL